ncbi:hypothetical protein ES702_03206 [subsurface metagenome]
MPLSKLINNIIDHTICIACETAFFGVAGYGLISVIVNGIEAELNDDWPVARGPEYMFDGKELPGTALMSEGTVGMILAIGKRIMLTRARIAARNNGGMGEEAARIEWYERLKKVDEAGNMIENW